MRAHKAVLHRHLVLVSGDKGRMAAICAEKICPGLHEAHRVPVPVYCQDGPTPGRIKRKKTDGPLYNILDKPKEAALIFIQDSLKGTLLRISIYYPKRWISRETPHFAIGV